MLLEFRFFFFFFILISHYYRILRNRAAAQESRDKKRKYVADLEAHNSSLLEENANMNKKVKQLEEQNTMLQSQLDAFTRQLATLQAQIKFNAITPISFNDFCDSARIARKLLSSLLLL